MFAPKVYGNGLIWETFVFLAAMVLPSLGLPAMLRSTVAASGALACRAPGRLSMNARRSTYAGVFLVALASLMYELLLTRIFSVTMWYHFAFMAISMAMLGMSAGALSIFLFPRRFPEHRTHAQLCWTALAFAMSIVVCFGLHLVLFTASGEALPDPISFLASFSIVAIPFVVGGMCLSLALTRFRREVGTLYAADLCGAALGCIGLWVALKHTDGPTSVIVAACLAGASAICFGIAAGEKRVLVIAALGGVLLTLLLGVQLREPFLRIAYAKGKPEADPIYERWNSFSRVTVYGDTTLAGPPFGWGLSRDPPLRPVRQLHLLIDATAGTVLTGFGGDLDAVDFLKQDVTNVAHSLRPGAKVLVIGTGGGRDILSALVFDQPSVHGIEINQNIIETVNGRFGDFTGHLDRYSGVHFTNDDARSYVERSREKYDLIQMSVIDTCAATSAGAFALSENSLYTLEGWTLFLDRLSPSGIFSVARFYSEDFRGEIYRMTVLASATLARHGVGAPRKHIAVVERPGGDSWGGPYGVATLLVSREPFSEQDLDQLERRVSELKFNLLVSPRGAKNEVLASLAAGARTAAAGAELGLDLSPPTDDRPFFFQMTPLASALRPVPEAVQRKQVNNTAVRFLALSLVEVGGLTLLFIFLPLLFRARSASFRTAGRPVVFFACIGLGFMLVEVSQLQRLNVFLGHPTYSLSVVLFTLLISSGVGSWATRYLDLSRPGPGGSAAFFLLPAVLLAFGLVTPSVLHFFRGSVTLVRIAVAVGMLAPVGLALGTAFPLGMRLASARHEALTPWLWGINGACSVCGSVVAVILAMSVGISGAFWAGLCCYAAAALALRGAASPAREPAYSGGPASCAPPSPQ